MPENYFTKDDPEPTIRKVFNVIGTKKKYWQDIMKFIRDNYELDGEFKLMGRSWVYWVRKSGRTLITFYIQKNNVVMQVVLGKKEVEKADELKFGKNVAEVYKKAKHYHDGKWLLINVKSQKDIKDIKELLLIKRKPVKKQ